LLLLLLLLLVNMRLGADSVVNKAQEWIIMLTN
jgi:hypothetical protein